MNMWVPAPLVGPGSAGGSNGTVRRRLKWDGPPREVPPGTPSVGRGARAGPRPAPSSPLPQLTRRRGVLAPNPLAVPNSWRRRTYPPEGMEKVKSFSL